MKESQNKFFENSEKKSADKIQKELNIVKEIMDDLSSDLAKVDEIIIDSCRGDAELISQIAQHITLSGGKRIRPILTILSAKICNYQVSENYHYNLAAAVELIHTATLLHDDVVDEGLMRRGKKTANSIWGNKASILVGDYLLSTAFQLMVKSKSLRVLDLLSKTSGIMSDGEVMQLMNSTDIEISEEKYLQIISQKTAILFAAATSSGAIIADSDKEKENSLYDYATNLGVAFQIMDDILDYSSSSQILGKEIGDDFFEGKVTLPVIIAYEKASKEEKSEIKDIFSQNLMSEEKDNSLFNRMMFFIKKYDAIEESFKKAQDYRDEGVKNLEIFDDCKEKKYLKAIIDYAVCRSK